jgi:hypothetical protein
MTLNKAAAKLRDERRARGEHTEAFYYATQPDVAFARYADFHPLARPIIEAGRDHDYATVHRLGQAIWDFKVGSKERDELSIAVFLATWYIHKNIPDPYGRQLP